ncbi:4-carboxymuconolactone decarboxylase [Sphingobium xenophagum]|uniref:4-carboxymuconolactone decarboxylase n=1 Tax=Sphingobium xenophagum TaxID=121428 RepID=A0ABU1X7I3_SPHXE|nr:carboxymuconolactone decarboxylase family protein [Sphingobium xenophagum]MDR7157087.1 4-carboxymuconolactone decarboxylase [Sphingobium xenophagum]
MTDLRNTGRGIMREVIGDDYFDKREASTNAFNAEARRLSEEYCFGEIWSRPGLDRKTRSLLSITTMIALNRQHELRIHVGTALNNGATPDEIREVLLQSIIYCGLPAGLEGVRVAEEVLASRGLL